MTTHPYELILATDLDGTFLEGDAEIKSTFYQALMKLRDKIMLIYTTGRPVETVAQFCKQGYLPYPDFVMGDHGTHIADGKTFQPVTHLQHPIIEKWNNGNEQLKTLLENDTGIELQPIDPPYRVAYYYDPKQLQPHTVEKITQAGFDVLLSSDHYLDILPPGVNKGASLLNFLKHFNLNHELVVTCGDSLNDLSLFETRLKSVAVGNAEPKLLTAIKQLKLENVYHSQYPGIWGIIDGLYFYEKNHLFEAISTA